MAYSYLDGSLTGGILNQQPAGTQANTAYTPGSGIPLYNAQQSYIPGTNIPSQQAGTGNLSTYQSALSQATNSAGQVDYPMLQRILGLTNEQMNTVIGQGEAWLTPDELRAKTNALQSNLWSGGGSGGGGGGGAADSATGGGGAASTTGSTAGANLGGLLNGVAGAQTTASPASLGSFPNINTGNIGVGGVNVGGGSQVGGPITGGLLPGNQATTNQQLPMMQMGAGNALQQYYNTPGYQLTNGQGAVNQFQTSPGYQFTVDQALRQVQQQGASRGLLDSGAGLRAMTDRAYGLANQEFNNWQQNQQNQYNQYQNRLQGLASGPVGADQAYGYGQQVGQNAMNTGSNIGSILANQGNTLFGGIVGAGGAQAQNVTQAGNMQAQILGSNLQTQMMLAALAAGRQ